MLGLKVRRQLAHEKRKIHYLFIIIIHSCIHINIANTFTLLDRSSRSWETLRLEAERRNKQGQNSQDKMWEGSPAQAFTM